MQSAGLGPAPGFWLSRSGVGPTNLHFSGGPDTAGPGATLGEPLSDAVDFIGIPGFMALLG